MPRGDGTGPRGMGSMTGRRAGYCAGSEMPGNANPATGRGFGMGFGRGRGDWARGFGGGGHGWRNRYHATGLPGWMRETEYDTQSGKELEQMFLKSRAEALQTELDLIKNRLYKLDDSTREAR